MSAEPGLDRGLAALDPARVPEELRWRDGYLDLLGDVDPTGPHPGQRWMASRALPLFYERAWRPFGAFLLMGPAGPRGRDERRIALEGLALGGGERVLDVACGPGNFTRLFAAAAGEGVVVGLDASRTMLARAVAETEAENVTYVRGDACAMPFSDASFDAVCCFAALYLIEHPMRALDEIARVLAPGGRVVLLSSCGRGPLSTAPGDRLVKALMGVRMFAREELTGALAERGFEEIDQRVSGFGQFICARRSAPAGSGLR
ncbi:MAG: methyltransferase domain-containing protein [Acidobacteriota bacterium]|nr:methyltransferase domain-containing protein [Acidobacteriota bacterium]